MRDSQYLSGYLDENGRRGQGNGLTIGTFLAYCLAGRAKSYAGRYATALENSLLRAGAIKGKSKLGRTAYYPAEPKS